MNTVFNSALYTKQTRKKTVTCHPCFPIHCSIEEDNKKISKLYSPERVETQPCFFIESHFHLVIPTHALTAWWLLSKTSNTDYINLKLGLHLSIDCEKQRL